MATACTDVQKAKKVLNENKGDSEKRREAGGRIAQAKETAKSSLAVRAEAVMGANAPKELLEISMNATTMYEGTEKGARQLKIDFTSTSKTAEKLRKSSGLEASCSPPAGTMKKEEGRTEKENDGFQWPEDTTEATQQGSKS